jgi:hypothetical protein
MAPATILPAPTAHGEYLKIPLLMFMGFPYNYTGEMVIALLDT